MKRGRGCDYCDGRAVCIGCSAGYAGWVGGGGAQLRERARQWDGGSVAPRREEESLLRVAIRRPAGSTVIPLSRQAG